ncbi:hypothetical protein B0H13DRAFT_2332560 [Mycena leptocephala]|nr:hypothetical protein B0H13DRAFT_2332560 [Mycena leptocephala]
MLERRQEVEETSGVKASRVTFGGKLSLPLPARVDIYNESFQIIWDRRRRDSPRAVSGVRGDTLEIEDLDTLTNPRGRLTGFCLNGVAAALHTFFSDWTPHAASRRRIVPF